MKLKFIPIAVFALSLSFVLSSYRPGAAHDGNTNATGSDGNTLACSGNGCHTSNLSTSLGTTLEFDSMGMPVTSYVPGMSYTVKITATNGTGLTLPKYGFQLACVTSASAGGGSTVQAGTWSSTLPSGVRNTPTSISGLTTPFIEQSTWLSPSSGTGGAGTVYTTTIGWTAPVAGTGSVGMYGAINAVNNNNNQSGDQSQQATPLVITEAIPAAHVGISEIAGLLTGFKAYPALMNSELTVAFDLNEASKVTISVLGMNGQTVKALANAESSSQGAFQRTFDMSGLSAGLYLVKVQIGNEFVISKVVKD